ncbi:MAG TPA: GNAT family N-acetyltransferase [Candidatus Brocadiaceae bacterium]|nr:GNAT family N-acetyltransferase [Candidatus Brocadiaceae bacterium]
MPGITKVGNLAVHVVDASVPLDVRQDIAHVAMVAARSMPEYPSGYDGTITEDDPRLYVLATGDRTVGFVLTALDKSFWRLSWKADSTIELLEDEPLRRQGLKIGRVWIAANYRRKGLVTQLVEVAAQHLSVKVSNLGWELPFTASGCEFVRRISPHMFLGCGDQFALRKSLKPRHPQQNGT